MVLHDGSSVRVVRLLVLGGAVAMAIAGVSANSWPQFRGPGGRGVAEGANLPERWSATDNIAWKTPVPGMVLAHRDRRSRDRHQRDQRQRD